MPILEPGSRVGPYTIVNLVRRGGMASIYRAEWERATDTEFINVAIKVANTATDVAGSHNRASEDLQSFYYEALNNEVEVLKTLRHPSIIRLYPIPWGIKRSPYIARATSIESSPWFCIMEYLEGGSVAQLLENEQVLDPPAAVEIAYQVASALDYIHAKGYSHLDVKPDNVLLRSPWHKDVNYCPQAVLADFGISQATRHMFLLAGSLPYLPPEQVPLVTGGAKSEPAAENYAGDIYALGVLLYKMLTGQLPFNGRSQAGTIKAIMNDEPPRPASLNADLAGPLEALILQALAKEPARRPSAGEFIMLLDEAVAPPRFAGYPAAVPAPGPFRKKIRSLLGA